MWQQIVDVLVCIASLVSVLDYFGVKPKRHFDGESSMPLGRKWKLGIMLILVALSLAMSGYDLYHQPRIPTSEEWVNEEKSLPVVSNRVFQNETVELDGKRFEGCKFLNVTFVIRGLKPYILENDVIGPPVVFKVVHGPQGSGASIWGFINDACRGHETSCDVSRVTMLIVDETLNPIPQSASSN